MSQGGFYDQKTIRPSGLALVIGLHAAALAALVLVKGPEYVRPDFGRTAAVFIPIPPPPPEDPLPQPKQIRQQVQAPSTPTLPPPVIDLQPMGPIFPPLPPAPPAPRVEHQVAMVEATRIDLPDPVRVEAVFDTRAGDLQPPYPPSEQRAEREGQVRVRVTIGTDGRVKAVQRISATSDAFWAVTERHALGHWRFRPATVDGRPVESTKVMNLMFRLET